MSFMRIILTTLIFVIGLSVRIAWAVDVIQTEEDPLPSESQQRIEREVEEYGIQCPYNLSPFRIIRVGSLGPKDCAVVVMKDALLELEYGLTSDKKKNILLKIGSSAWKSPFGILLIDTDGSVKETVKGPCLLVFGRSDKSITDIGVLKTLGNVYTASALDAWKTADRILALPSVKSEAEFSALLSKFESDWKNAVVKIPIFSEREFVEEKGEKIRERSVVDDFPWLQAGHIQTELLYRYYEDHGQKHRTIFEIAFCAGERLPASAYDDDRRKYESVQALKPETSTPTTIIEKKR